MFSILVTSYFPSPHHSSCNSSKVNALCGGSKGHTLKIPGLLFSNKALGECGHLKQHIQLFLLLYYNHHFTEQELKMSAFLLNHNLSNILCADLTYFCQLEYQQASNPYGCNLICGEILNVIASANQFKLQFSKIVFDPHIFP